MLLELVQIQLQMLIAAYQEHEENNNRVQQRRMWQLPLIQARTTRQAGIYHNLFRELRDGSNPKYCHHDYFRMSRHTFDYILGKIAHRYLLKYDLGVNSLLQSKET